MLVLIVYYYLYIAVVNFDDIQASERFNLEIVFTSIKFPKVQTKCYMSVCGTSSMIDTDIDIRNKP